MTAPGTRDEYREFLSRLRLLLPSLGSPREYTFAGVTYRVMAGRTDLLDEVDQFLSPHLFASGDGETVWSVALLTDVPVPCHAGESRALAVHGGAELLMGAHIEIDGAHFIYNSESGAFTVVDPHQRQAFVATNGTGHGLAFLEDCYSLVRNLCFHALQVHGALLIHGATVRVGGRTYLIAGHKGSGKTTLQHFAMQAFEGQMVSADRTVLFCDAKGAVQAAPWISTYRLDLRTRSLFPLAEGWDRLVEYAESKRSDPDYVHNHKLRLAPAQAAQFFGFPVVPVAPLDEVLVLFDPSPDGGFCMEQLAREKASECMTEHRMDLDKMGILSGLPPVPGHTAAAERTAEALISSVPFTAVHGWLEPAALGKAVFRTAETGGSPGDRG